MGEDTDKRARQQPFSVDEMMERLKTRPSRSNSRVIGVEVVDNQTVEVRKKRKRRSHQPKKAKERRAVLLRKSLLFCLVPLVLFSIAYYFLSKMKYESDSFREKLSDAIIS